MLEAAASLTDEHVALLQAVLPLLDRCEVHGLHVRQVKVAVLDIRCSHVSHHVIARGVLGGPLPSHGDLEEIPCAHDTVTTTGEMRVPQRHGDPTVRSGGLLRCHDAGVHGPHHVDDAALLGQGRERDRHLEKLTRVHALPSLHGSCRAVSHLVPELRQLAHEAHVLRKQPRLVEGECRKFRRCHMPIELSGDNGDGTFPRGQFPHHQLTSTQPVQDGIVGVRSIDRVPFQHPLTGVENTGDLVHLSWDDRHAVDIEPCDLRQGHRRPHLTHIRPPSGAHQDQPPPGEVRTARDRVAPVQREPSRPRTALTSDNGQY